LLLGSGELYPQNGSAFDVAGGVFSSAGADAAIPPKAAIVMNQNPIVFCGSPIVGPSNDLPFSGEAVNCWSIIRRRPKPC